jgi:hypothetical protein
MSDKKYIVKTAAQRRKHAVVMRKMMHRLMSAKARKRNKHASGKELVRRSKHLAKRLFLKKYAGSRGENYSELSFHARAQLDSVFNHLAPQQMDAMAKRLLPHVRAHEKARVSRVRKEEVEIGELVEGARKRVDHVQKMMSRAATAQVSKHKRAKNSASAMSHRLKGGSDQALTRAKSRTSRAAASAQRHGKNKPKTKYGKLAALMMLRLGSDNASLKRIGKVMDKNKRNARRFNRSDGSRTNYSDHFGAVGKGTLKQDMDYDMVADFILEGSAAMDKFEALFRRGLVDKSEIEINKRIFGDLDRSIKQRRFHDDIVSMLEKLIKLITTDDTIYNKVTQSVQRRNR